MEKKSGSQTYSVDSVPTIVDMLYQLKDECSVYTFTGSLGAGKTTLVRALLRRWGVHEPITSPTFGYVNTYEVESGTVLYHFDLYRLSSVDEFIEAGFDELLYMPNSWAFIEWPEIIMPILKNCLCKIAIEYGSDQMTRKLTYQIIP